jgi:hypothetical protein
MNNKRGIGISICLFALALVLAVLGAGFSWRQVFLGGLAIFMWGLGAEIWKTAFATPGFTRIQFRIGLEIGKALHDAGLYADELPQASSIISEKLIGNGWIIFTWLESELFFLNTINRYSSTLDFSIDLPMVGIRQPERRYELTDMIEMRSATDGYELVLLTREDRYCWPDSTRNKGLVLFTFPYKFFWAFQGTGEPREREKEAHKVLAEVPSLKYQEVAEVASRWDYQSEYGSFRWWPI